MSRRWQPPKPKTPQQELLLTPRGRFAPPVKLATDTSVAAAESLGMSRAGDLASAMVGVLDRNAAQQRLGGAMLAVEVRAKVMNWLEEHPEGATADEIAQAIGHQIWTVRPRVSELKHMKPPRVADSGKRRTNASRRNAIVWVIAK